MLNTVIRFALRQRLVVAAAAMLLLIVGGVQISRLPIDVFPNLDRPRVTVMVEAHDMWPEELEKLITQPLETALNGATGVQAVRSRSGMGISVIQVDFDWGTDIYRNRQIVNERLALAHLPEDVTPHLAPISSIMGQIMVIGMYVTQSEETLLFSTCRPWPDGIADGPIPDPIREEFAADGIVLSDAAYLKRDQTEDRWFVVDPADDRWFAVLPRGDAAEVHRAVSPMRLRTIADWNVRRRLLTIGGISQVFVMGGDRKQYQVLVNPYMLPKFGVTLKQIRTALERSNRNATGGYLDERGPHELLVRSEGRIQKIEDLQEVVVAHRQGRSVLLKHVARVVEGPQVKRGEGAAYARNAEGNFSGGQAVVLTINKQPNADTSDLTDRVTEELRKIEASLAAEGVRIHPELYQQKVFIDRAIDNVVEALEDGGILVLVILFLFLLNIRTTFITLTAIPLSIVITALVFAWFKLSINTMTLGGLAVAIGELVDDAIVDVENIFRRLRENRHKKDPKPGLLVVFQASVEIRNSIVFGTLIVVLAFIPVFALGGMEGRLFNPLGIAYIVSILSSLLVSLTLTPVLCYWLLACRRVWPVMAGVLAPAAALAASWWILPQILGFLGLSGAAVWLRQASWRYHVAFCVVAGPLLWLGAMYADRFSHGRREGFLLRGLKRMAGRAITTGLKAPAVVLLAAVVAVAGSGVALLRLERHFLPPFDEGTVQINVVLPAGTSLATSRDIVTKVEGQLQKLEYIQGFVCKTGRAELDEHTVSVSSTEVIATIAPNTKLTREQINDDLEKTLLENVPGIQVGVEQPLQHLISHMLSGVQAQVAIKLYGDDLVTLRRTAEKMGAIVAEVEGVRSPLVQQQTEISQLVIRPDDRQLVQPGLHRDDVNEFVDTAMRGVVLSDVLIGQKTFDLLLRLDEPYREDLEAVRRFPISLPGDGTAMLGSLAEIDDNATGPNAIRRENAKRQIVVSCNVAGRGLVDVVQEIRAKLTPIEESLPPDYFIEYGGQFESQRSASRTIALFFALSLAGTFLVLYVMFRSANLALQVMIALPMAFIGSVAALYVTDQKLSVAAMVGFISLCGIASRNGILLLNHYLHLVKYEGETFSRKMITRAGKERLAPVLMTALTSGIGLVPLAMAAGEPGKEILYPVATVIIGGLISSTLLEFLVRPALFWIFGTRAAAAVLQRGQSEIDLVEEKVVLRSDTPILETGA